MHTFISRPLVPLFSFTRIYHRGLYCFLRPMPELFSLQFPVINAIFFLPQLHSAVPAQSKWYVMLYIVASVDTSVRCRVVTHFDNPYYLRSIQLSFLRELFASVHLGISAKLAKFQLLYTVCWPKPHDMQLYVILLDYRYCITLVVVVVS